MQRPIFIFAIIGLLLLSACKNNKEEPGIEERNEVEEITFLTEADRIEDFLEDFDTGTTELYNATKVSDFYKKNDFQPIWSKRELREDLFRNIENIEDEGLFFEDYHGERLQKLLSSLDTNAEVDNDLLELLLTDSYLRLAKDLATGKLDPTKIHEIWGTPLNTIDAEKVLEKAISEGNIHKSLDSLKPDHLVYHQLKSALNKFKKNGIEEGPTTKISTGKLIRPGDNSDRMPSIAKRLSELGYFNGISDSTNTIYNEDIQKAVKEFQLDHDLQEDALLGSTTISNLNLTRRDRYHQILVNLERWRWYPKNLGKHYIIVNIPDYELSVIKEEDTIRTHKIMVGTEVRKTPIFSDEIGYIIYNPTWTIPPTIKKNDVIPGAKKDIGYFQKKNIKIYDSEGTDVDPASVDWNSSKARGYTYRQPAGPTNPLGIVKIIYPNEYLIYLHDTPSRSLFEKNARAQSSGCVRVQDALGLAKYLLSDQDSYDDEKIEEILKSGKTTQITVKQKVKVHHFYWTVYQKKDAIKFIDDIYNLDQKTWDLLKPEA
ncbi:L,D-transpeptidase family protein [Christiangramia forsetii]|uniref:Protein containing peptidoglycan binding-like domain n=2 Tax=Christiangramia forsetii TaxID=411153 RepID=A0LYF6_CHRFK|nr:L,D-transpeptidase family protein [Christiangramia forsetii]GGG34343.1 peptidoglycan-binding protein [Christiangramia forsetii]CAL65401.1 protein containing peptidoglycan binding-like domain [Christiangramia forsetii KT0803]